MSSQRVLLTGGSGLLALNWACAIRDRHEVVLGTHKRGVALRGARAVPLNLDNAGDLERAIRDIAPDVVVHTAGITSVEACEANPGEARRVYEDLSRNVAHAAQAVGARLIHISTDHLFRGTRSMYTEDDQPEPVNTYGQVKWLAEQAAFQAAPDALVLRTNFFGWGHRYRQSFSDWIYYALSERRPITLFEDVHITPILADRLALAAHDLLDRGARGVLNVVSDARVSKYDFGMHLAQAFELPADSIHRGTLAASATGAHRVHRPPDMSLDNRRARALLGTSLGNPSEDLQHLARQARSGRRDELLAAVTE